MYDPTDRAYKQCAGRGRGPLPAVGAACAPKSRCMFDPADGLHHHCDAPAAGGLGHYGPLCAP